MTKDELITKQQLEIESLKEMISSNDKVKEQLEKRFYSIGAPLNDNKLKFNTDQLKWCMEIVTLVEEINCK